jgi:lysophospholipase L1-like esterase
MSARRTNRRRRWLIALAGAMLAFGLAEFGLRQFHDVRKLERAGLNAAKPHAREVLAHIFRRDDDEAIRYTLVPGKVIVDGGSRYAINSLGMRGPETTRAKPEGTRRVLVIGDSYGFGLGVAQESTVAALLQKRFDALGGTHVEVLNQSVPGYHTGQELALLEREGFALQPDVIVLFYCWNDEADEAFQFDEKIGVLHGDLLPVPYAWKRWLRRSALYSFVAHTDAMARLQAGELRPLEPHQWKPTRARLVALFEACRQRRVPLVVLNLPKLEMGATFQLPDPKWEPRAHYDRIGKLCEEHGVRWIDLRALLIANVDLVERLFVRVEDPADPHLNARGYDIVSAELAETLVELGLTR